jgi:hypothetical protein
MSESKSDWKDFRKESRSCWGARDRALNINEVQVGCFLRMADSLELIAKDKQKLENEVRMYKEWYQERKNRCAILEKRIAGYKGRITYLTKKLKKEE